MRKQGASDRASQNDRRRWEKRDLIDSNQREIGLDLGRYEHTDDAADDEPCRRHGAGGPALCDDGSILHQRSESVSVQLIRNRFAFERPLLADRRDDLVDSGHDHFRFIELNVMARVLDDHVHAVRR